jgi:hypothetical protein
MVSMLLTLRVSFRESIHVALQCCQALLPSGLYFWRLNLVAVVASGITVITIHEAGKSNAADETAAVELSIARSGGRGKTGFLMGSQILVEMSIDMLIDCASAEGNWLSLVSKQPFLIRWSFLALAEQSGMMSCHQHC